MSFAYKQNKKKYRVHFHAIKHSSYDTHSAFGWHFFFAKLEKRIIVVDFFDFTKAIFIPRYMNERLTIEWAMKININISALNYP